MDVHVSTLPAHLPHPDQNICSIIASLSDGSISYTQTNDTKAQHIVLHPHRCSSAVRLAALGVLVHNSLTHVGRRHRHRDIST